MSRSTAAFALVVVGAISVANVIKFLLAATWIGGQTGTAIGFQRQRNFIPAVP